MNLPGKKAPLLKKVKNFSLTFMVIFLTFSCTEFEKNIPKVDQEKTIHSLTALSEYEENLKNLTLIFGEVLKDPAARAELFSFSEINEGRDDIDYSLKELFEKGEHPLYKKRSAIVSGFTEQANRRNRLYYKINFDELIQFIKDNDISVVAPYLAEDFDPNQIEDLTLSWWTQEFENEQLALNKDWKGATKAIKMSLVGENTDNQHEYFLANDEWAMKNPTIVLGSFPDLEFDVEQINGNLKVETSALSANMTGSPVQLCDVNNKANQNIIVRMPALRLEDNIRRWPNANEMYLWVAFANDIELGSDGLPKISSDVNMPLARFTITRKEANIKRWKVSNTSFIVSAWKPEADNMYLVWGCTRTEVNIDVEGGVKASKTGVSGEAKVKVAIRNSVELVSALSFDKCFTIANNINETNQGYGYYGSTRFPVYAFGNVRTYFTLESL
ncbi:hypothetical protein [Algoriphagus confluentis]|uniref:Uncharacterized protein n=1 Tax=Algoriphagus confluentis TaxID=1697556 RepID=A0ABQ6PKV3_9BACT|nr:hypothetical protein Aconfl_08100 [Algoriphagus confluentis]